MKERIANACSIISNSAYSNNERAFVLRSIVEKIVFDKEYSQIKVYYRYL